jgi:hypothetical protein
MMGCGRSSSKEKALSRGSKAMPGKEIKILEY